MNTTKTSALTLGDPNYTTDHPFDLAIYPLPSEILLEEVFIEMRDGVRLAANVFRVEGAEPAPVIVTSTPYGKDNYDQWNYFRDAPIGNVPGGGGFYLGQVRISDRTAFEAPDPGYWVPRGYVVVLVDHPGMGRSQSNPAADPALEDRWHDIIDWLADQPWCSGSVGMSGVSALCATQWIAAKDPAPRALKAIIPWEDFNESGPGGGYGGIPETSFPHWLKSQWIAPNINPDGAGPERLFAWNFDTSKIGIPALICASFSDQELHTWDTFDAFTRIASKAKWLYGHRRQKWGAFYGKDELECQKGFLDRFLKGDDSAFQNKPAVRLEVNEDRFTHQVVTADNWPLPGTSYEALFLDAESGTLLTEQPSASVTKRVSALEAGNRDNSLTFDLKVESPTSLVGHMALRLFVETQDSNDADIFVGVEKIDVLGNKVYFFSSSGGNANGPATRGWLRLSKRKLKAERSTEWRPVLDMASSSPVVPGHVTEVNIPLMPSGTKFHPGETLRLVVQAWSIPGQWEGGETRQWDTIKKGSYRIHTGPEFPSRLLVPVISRNVGSRSQR